MECDIVVGTIQNMFSPDNEASNEDAYKCEHLTKNQKQDNS